MPSKRTILFDGGNTVQLIRSLTWREFRYLTFIECCNRYSKSSGCSPGANKSTRATAIGSSGGLAVFLVMPSELTRDGV